MSDRMMVFIEDGHVFQAFEEVPWKMLTEQRVITLSRESNIRVLTEIGFESVGVPLRPHLEVHQIHTALSLAENGAGVAVLPTYAFTALNGRHIAARPLTSPDFTRQVSIVSARERTASPATAAVSPLLRRIVREMVPEAL
ncbi:LysR substrate-binding domain-containing protein [Roseibium polysiphoniae]|uniref:LysR substrate-binding domain-containing protein n=1 Tax=Roseibium polysiphoniae TaxID=2571221 RepID=UPI001BD1ABB7|nr:LysR substrate-binding domain-containing protein [Roseibium polysiphoniae]